MKNLNNTKISLGEYLPRLDAASDAPIKLVTVFQAYWFDDSSL